MKAVYHVIFRDEPEGGFTAIVPSLPGCVTYGKTLEEARRMTQDAIQAYVASLKKHQEPIPTDEAVFTAEIHVDSNREKKREYA